MQKRRSFPAKILALIVLLLIFTFLLVILRISFFTLCERKILAHFQLRKGPNKVSIRGVFQPFRDAIKLLSKERFVPHNSHKWIFWAASVGILRLRLCLWACYIRANPSFYTEYCVLYFIVISSLAVFTTLLAGWASNSKYAFLGRVRSIAQTISYEIVAGFILLIVCLFSFGFNLGINFLTGEGGVGIFFIGGLFFFWFLSILAETNRRPFDFVEGERELVRGFNVEYGSEKFILIFMAEYLNIMFVRLLTSALFVYPFLGGLGLYFTTLIFCFLFIYVRASLPRFRLDTMIRFFWQSALPFVLGRFFFFGRIFYLLFLPAIDFPVEERVVSSFFMFGGGEELIYPGYE